MAYQCISIDEAKVIIESTEVTIIDMRDSQSFLVSNIQTSINVLGENIDEFLSAADKDKPLIVYCYHGNSSKGAADYFFSQGHKEVYSLNGGFEAWRLHS
jgi:thiosulfate sulfurtransferase